VAARASAAPQLHERVAVIDLGPGDLGPGGVGPAGSGAIRQKLDAALVAAGFEPVAGDGVEDALSGRDVDRDAAQLATAIATAQRAFGELRCGDATTAAQQAIGIAAARQAAGRAVPELPRAWSLVLLCADRDGRLDAAVDAAHQLRALGGSSDVPASVWAKYPAIDAIAGRELVEIDVDADVPGSAIWIDFRPVGTAPVHIELPAGPHVLAAAAGIRRGWAAGTAVATQRSVRVPMFDPTGPWSDVARHVASWHGKLPPPSELTWVLARVRARVALVRHGDTVEAWGQIGRSEVPHRLGGDDAVASIAEPDRVVGLVADRVRAWNGHAPDPDRPLLVETREPRSARDEPEPPTKWWVYAAIVGAAAVAATIVYAHDSASDHQRVELHYP
jgi:hypothetical protein